MYFLGLVLLVTIAFLTGHSVARYVRELAPLTPLTRSAALRFATLASLARSLRSLPHGTVEIHEYVFMLKSRFTGTIEILIVRRNTPCVCLDIRLLCSSSPLLSVTVHLWYISLSVSVSVSWTTLLKVINIYINIYIYIYIHTYIRIYIFIYRYMYI